jgi:hypothetical protein
VRCCRVIWPQINEAADVDGFFAFDGKPPHIQRAERRAQRTGDNHPAKEFTRVRHPMRQILPRRGRRRASATERSNNSNDPNDPNAY